ncbi:MAG: putative transporter [Paracidovorax wautersii]|uniref:Putative transporter n=1 Tax=Paracidovorax wautersii TaxID=1177982 RepID=A0A7V8FMU9_9BURK|nr:MAG: putative transporter [Paracidovorax wautersii]
MVETPSNKTAPVLGKGALATLAAACGITVGNVYLCQPLLDQIAVNMGVPEQTVGLVAVGAQVGYALGILFVLPLADAVATRRLVRVLLILTTLFLLVACLSPSTPVLIAASTVVPQVLIPVVSGLAAPEHRGRVIGTLQTVLILGILLSRTVSGGVAQAFDSWRSPYLLAAVLTAGLTFIVPRLMPAPQARPAAVGYLNLLRSLPPLLRHRPLRLSMALGFLVFAAFSAFWATLAFHLASPAFGLGPAAAGLFGLYGALGALLAPTAGRLSDRIGSGRVNLSLVAVAVAFALGGWLGACSLLALVLAVNLLDFGLQSGQIANQTRIFALGGDIRARVNTLYMVATFGGGAAGSLAGTVAWGAGGWHGVCLLALLLVAAAGVVLMLQRRAQA